MLSTAHEGKETEYGQSNGRAEGNGRVLGGGALTSFAWVPRRAQEPSGVKTQGARPREVHRRRLMKEACVQHGEMCAACWSLYTRRARSTEDGTFHTRKKCGEDLANTGLLDGRPRRLWQKSRLYRSFRSAMPAPQVVSVPARGARQSGKACTSRSGGTNKPAGKPAPGEHRQACASRRGCCCWRFT
jgi:hypothetical protein